MRRFAHCCLLPVLASTAKLVNRTIDDNDSTSSAPRYLPKGGWAFGPECTGCSISQYVDRTQVFDRTWHDSTYYPDRGAEHNVTVTFTGQAVYVFNMLSDYIPTVATFTNLTFVLDGEHVANYTRKSVSQGPQPLHYHEPVYVNTSLQDGEHTLVMSAGGGGESLILFDYLVYT
ncbi:hypothetical protein C8Q77DRAFT_1020693, partial [Trametes polyzona]